MSQSSAKGTTGKCTDYISACFYSPSLMSSGCLYWGPSTGTGTPRATVQQGLDAAASPACCDKAWYNLGAKRWRLYPAELFICILFYFSFLNVSFVLTFSSAATVIYGDVLLLPPLSSCQYAGVVCGFIAVVQLVILEDVPTLLIGRLGQQGPVGCHKFTVEGRRQSWTVCIMAV